MPPASSDRRAATPQASPRKSSTSSGRHPARPRYLGIEVSGDRTLSPRGLESILRERLGPGVPGDARVRVVRLEGARALVEVPHTLVPQARVAWNGSWVALNGLPVSFATRATWGTLVKGKAWLRGE